MKIIRIFLLLLTIILLVGCEDGANLRVNNNTNHNIYFSIEDNSYTLEGQESKTISVDTKERVLLFTDGKTKKVLNIIGETYRLWDPDNDFYPDETEITFTPGKTYKVFCNPNSASLKVVNNSDWDITRVRYRKNSDFQVNQWFQTDFDPPLRRGDVWYNHLTYQTEENRFFYNFEVQSGEEIIYTVGDEHNGIELSIDQQHLIEINE